MCAHWRDWQACCKARLPDPHSLFHDAVSRRNARYQVVTFCNDLAVIELNASAVHGVPISTLQPGEFTSAAGYPLTALGWGYTKPLEE